MNIEDELRGALHVAAPPPTTTLEAVVKRGRRRVFAQRAGAALGVVAVVAGIGFSAATLNHAAPPPQQADEPNHGPATVEHGLGWPRVVTPAQQPYSTWTPASSAPPAPGRAVVDVPMCNMRMATQEVVLSTEPFTADFTARLLERVPRELPDKKIGNAPGNSVLQAVEFDITDAGGTGSLRVTGGRFTGTPQAYADDALWETGDCEPPKRLVLSNGTIVQLHAVRPFEPFQSLVQRLSVFRNDGLLVQLELRNFGSPDLAPDPKQQGQWRRTGAGRSTLPLSEEEFSRLGLVVAATP